MDALQRLQTLIQQKSCIVDEHVDVAHKLLSRAIEKRFKMTKINQTTQLWFSCYFRLDLHSLELLQEGSLMANILPQAFKYGADVVADSELVIKLASCSSVLHIYKYIWSISIHEMLSMLQPPTVNMNRPLYLCRTSWGQGRVDWQTAGGSPSSRRTSGCAAALQG